jgi:hypothetical protein
VNGDAQYTPWKRSTVRLANGESAVVVAHQFEEPSATTGGFSVITSSTLINVSGEFRTEQVAALASLLRPL